MTGKASASASADPRKPMRPEGDRGSNWAVCLACGRGAGKVKLIRHKKNCPSRKLNACN